MQASGLKPNWVEIDHHATQLEKKDIGPFKPSQINIAISVLKESWDQYATFIRDKKSVLHIKIVKEVTIRCLITDKGQVYIVLKGDKSPKISSGNKRCIRHGLWLNTMQLTAVKISKRDFEEPRNWLQEAKMFESKMVKDNPLFVQMKDYCTYTSKKDYSSQKLAIVTEWCNLTDAVDAIQKLQKISNYEFLQIIPFCFQILLELNKNAVLHRDIKLINIFAHRNDDGSLTFKLGDFGTTNSQEDELTLLKHNDVCIPGTAGFESPEVVRFNVLHSAFMTPPLELIESVCSLSTDVWSVGVLLINMLYGADILPTKTEDIQRLTQQKLNKIIDACFESKLWCDLLMETRTKENLFQCIRGMLQIDPKKRLTGPQAYEIYHKK